jgi:hypothetical protein
MAWRRNMLPMSLVFLAHGLLELRHAPQTYDDPEFINKLIHVALGIAVIAFAHFIQKEEDRLESTRS